MDILYAAIDGLTQVFVWPAFGFLLLGVAVGFAVGILPGLGGPVTLALMLPFIFGLSHVEAISFLLGMAAVTATTGDITSILFGVPGEGTAAATVVDGHPMAKEGQAGRALGAVLMSSLIGAILGAVALGLAIPIVRPLVLSIGSPELFMLAVVGTTMIASLSGGTLLKGLIAGCMGFMLATVGVEPSGAIERYTFGQLYLWDGVGLLPVTLGLFAIPEIIELAVGGSSIAQRKIGKLGGVFEGVKDTFRHWWLVIRCAALGAYVGLVPGMGGAVSQWVAYAHAVQSAKDKEKVGHGAIEGVLGPGAANNATLGGALIPTVAFGVPGNLSTAILLGAFIIQGLVPGPAMLIPETQGGHLSLTFSMVWLIVVSNIVAVSVCFMFLNHLAKLTQVRGSLLIPFIIALVYLGAYAEKNTFEDVAITLVFGILGWAMYKLDWPRPPLLIGLVLSPIAENRFFLSMDSYGFAWMLRPGVVLLFVLMLIGIGYSSFRAWRRESRFSETHSTALIGRNRFDMPVDGIWIKGLSSPEFYFSLLIVCFFAAMLWLGRDLEGRAAVFPWMFGLAALVLAIAQGFRELVGPQEENNWFQSRGDISPELEKSRTVAILTWIAVFFSIIWLIGFEIGVPVAVLLYLKFGSCERWDVSVALSTLSFVFVYGVMSRLLHIPFPPGLLFSLSGV